jgi:hypothetical protein
MTHWEVAQCFMVGSFLGLCALAGYIVGGIVY